MTWMLTLATGAFLVAMPPEQGGGKEYTFAKKDVGKVPAGWKVDRTGKGDGSRWQVVADASAPSKSGFAIAQMAQSPGPTFNLCVLEESRFKDGEIRVAFKAVRGRIDQGGGLVWRYQDANTYYIARYNPLENNYRVYKVVDGKRIQLATKEQLKVPAGEWHTLKVRHVGDRIECFLDDVKHLEAKDNAITKEGKVGLWTKADARTFFDNLAIQAAKREYMCVSRLSEMRSASIDPKPGTIPAERKEADERKTVGDGNGHLVRARWSDRWLSEQGRACG